MRGARGYTVIELMVTAAIVAILAATVGTGVVWLLTLKEREREEAYYRETLADICGIYADCFSVGSLVGVKSSNSVDVARAMDLRVEYRTETGGVSLETGRVSRVTSLYSTNGANGTVDLSIDAFEAGGVRRGKLTRSLSGNASLVPLRGEKVAVRCSATPLVGVPAQYVPMKGDADFLTVTNAPLWNLRFTAEYEFKNGRKGERGTAVVERVVRLWNRE